MVSEEDLFSQYEARMAEKGLALPEPDPMADKIRHGIRIANPDEDAKIVPLARERGIPKDVAKDTFDTYERSLRDKGIDIPAVLREQPATGRLLSGDSYLIADEVHDHVDREKRIKGQFSEVQESALLLNRTASLTGNFIEMLGNASELQIRKMFPGFSDEQVAEIGAGKELKDIGHAISEGADIAYEVQNQFTWEDLKGDLTPKNLAGYIYEQGITSLPDMIAVMYTLPAYIMARTEEMGDELAENRGKQDAGAQEFVQSMATATMSAWLERIGARQVFKLAGVRSYKDAAKDILSAATMEGITEFFQESTEYAGTTLFSDRDFSVREMLERGLAGMVAGAGMGAAIRGATANAEAAIYKANRSTKEQDVIDELEGVVTQTKLAERNPEAAVEYAQDLADTYGIEGAYLDETEVETYLQDNPDSVLKQAYLDSGGDVQLTIKDYLSLPEAERQSLRPMVRLSGDGLSQSDLQSFEERETERIDSLVQEAQRNVDMHAQAKEIYNDVADQLADTGVYTRRQSELQAQLIPAYVTTKAAREGMAVEEVYNQMGLEIRRVEDMLEEGELELGQPAMDLTPGGARIQQDFSGAVLQEQVQVEETGEVVSVETQGDRLQRDWDQAAKRRDTVAKLLDCL